MLNDTERHVLAALVRLARHNRHATAIRVAAAIGATPTEVREVLATLDAKGFVDAERVRLSLNGLAVAMGLGSCAEVRARPRRRVVKAAA